MVPTTCQRISTGSSPRSRGAPGIGCDQPQCRRIIPAGAGSTGSGLALFFMGRDHPRGRGEHAIDDGVAVGKLGSSPRARGALDRARVAARLLRIIPAGAGSTPNTHPSTTARKDHPRGRGEHAGGQDLLIGESGSSPRARGALAEHMRVPHNVRIIPAGAGSTPASSTCAASTRDQPRGRGEHTIPS